MKIKILIIEDEYDIRDTLKDILELAGYDVYVAENGHDGVQKAIIEKPDLIICDILMPEMDGYQVISILAQNPECINIPFIYLTAKADLEDFKKGLRLGADDYIAKPFDHELLLNAIQKRLRKNLSTAKYPPVRNDFQLNYDQKIWLLVKNSFLSLNVNQIVFIKAEAKYSRLHMDSGEKYFNGKSLKEWELILPSLQFRRIHRSTIVNLNYVENIDRWEKTNHVISLKNLNEKLTISVRYFSNFMSSVIK